MSKTEKKYYVGNVHVKIKDPEYIHIQLEFNKGQIIPIVGDNLADELRALADEVDKRKKELKTK